VTLYCAAFSVDGNSGKIANVLVRPCKLIEKGGLTAVLVARKGKGKHFAVGKGRFGAFNVVFTLFAKTRMVACGRMDPFACGLLGGNGRNGSNIYICSVFKAERKLVAVEAKLHGVSHWGKLNKRDFCSGNNAHIEKMLSVGSFAANACNDGRFTGRKIFKGHRIKTPLVSTG
jgi:hypothetical protein